MKKATLALRARTYVGMLMLATSITVIILIIMK
jgi:hypothetical protein